MLVVYYAFVYRTPGNKQFLKLKSFRFDQSNCQMLNCMMVLILPGP